MQGNESAQLVSLLGSMKATPSRGSTLDYFMLRMPKMNEEQDEADENINDEGGEQNPFLARAITQRETNSAVTLSSGAARDLRMTDRKQSVKLRMSVKVNLRSTETSL